MQNPLEWQQQTIRPFGFFPPRGLVWPVEWYRYGERPWSFIREDAKKAGHAVGVHCFTADRRFETLWNTGVSRQKLVAGADLFLGPDFSFGASADLVPAIYQIWRSNVLSRALKTAGLPVVPVLLWGPRSPVLWQYAASGIETGSVVCLRLPVDLLGEEADYLFWEPLAWFLDRIKPQAILWAGPIDSPHMKRVALLTEIVRVRNRLKFGA